MSQATMIYSEMLDILECPEAYTTKDFKDRMYELMEEIKKDEDQINDVIFEIQNDRLDNSYCPKCGERLRIREISEDREYQGAIFPETISTQYCHECGWTEDNN